MGKLSIFIHLLFSSVWLNSVLAQDTFVGSIMIWPMNFAPNGWAFCDGALLQISEFETLFSLIGTTYGGDGQTTFALPDLVGRFPLGAGAGHNLGEVGGAAGETTIPIRGAAQGPIFLRPENLPPHTHSATFTGMQSEGKFRTEIEVVQAAGKAVPQPGGSLSQGSASGTGGANIFAPPGSSAPSVPLAGGSGSFVSTPAGSVNIDAAGQGEPIFASLPVDGSGVLPLPPYTTLNYIISLYGIYPSQN
ncbi:hypothetical protein CI109_103869 [Kwoniella shandongensis]|uniref:Phage tail collar domain-containing protein n=1 Tax=Kwoniella shandongensis TaxID=1734106 RepID=A0AAJ8LLQ6_9TREE